MELFAYPALLVTAKRLRNPRSSLLRYVILPAYTPGHI
jgi:hypothetical protein